jgi:hypothetical protein
MKRSVVLLVLCVIFALSVQARLRQVTAQEPTLDPAYQTATAYWDGLNQAATDYWESFKQTATAYWSQPTPTCNPTGLCVVPTPVGGYPTGVPTLIPPATTTPGPNDVWTKSIKFEQNTCFNIIEGQNSAYSGLKFSDSPGFLLPGHLIANIRLPVSVTPSLIILSFRSQSGIIRAGYDPDATFSFHVYGSVSIFGVNQYYDRTTNHVVWSDYVNPLYAGASGTDINLNLAGYGGEDDLYLEEIWLQGFGPSPFANLPDEIFNASDYLPCYAGPTATPAPPTATDTPAPPTDTPEPSDTPTPTDTPSPTATATPGGPWVEVFDFRLYNPTEDFDKFVAVTAGQWESGVGWKAANSGAYSSFALYLEAFWPEETTDTHFTYMSVTGVDTGDSEWFTDYGGNPANPFFPYEYPVSDGAFFREWTGNQPITPATFNSTYGMYASFFSFIAGAYAGQFPVVARVEVRGTGYDPFQQIALPTPTPTATGGTATPTDTPSPTYTPSRTRTPNPFATPTLTPYNAHVTPGTPAPSPTPTNTRLPINVPPTYTAPPLGTLPPPPPTATPFPTLTYTASTTPMMLATTGTPVIITVVPNETSVPLPGDDHPGGLGGLGGALLSLVTNAWQQSIRYLREMSGRATGIVDAWRVAATRAIPGMPQCASNRLASELCAIYYILTYTLFSGTLGSLILPAALLVIDLRIVLKFVMLVRAILTRLAKIQKT